MSGYDPKLAEDYEKEAQAASDRIAKITAGVADMNFEEENFDMDFGADDDDPNDDDLDKLLNGDNDKDDDLLNLFGNDDGDDIDIDMDDPNALEKFEQAEKAKELKKQKQQQEQKLKQQQEQKAKQQQQQEKKPLPQQQQQEQKPKPSAKEAKEQPKEQPKQQNKPQEKPATTAKPKESAAKQESGTTAAQRQQRVAEYKKLLSEIKGNIEVLNNQITGILRQKKPDAKEHATKVMNLRKRCEQYLVYTQNCVKQNLPVPSYSYTPYTMQQEYHNDEIQNDQMRVTLIGVNNIAHSGTYYITCDFELGNQYEHSFKRQKGKGFLSYNDVHTFELIKNFRVLKTMQSKLRKFRVNVSLYKAGLLWGTELIGKCELKLQDLASLCSAHVTAKLRDDSVVGEVEVKVDLYKPFCTAQLVDTIINLVQVDINNTTKDSSTTQTIAEAAAAAATATAAASTTTTKSPTSPSKTSAPAASEPVIDLEKIENMTTPEIIKASGVKLSVDILEKIDQLQQFVSFDTITYSIDECKLMISKNEFKRGFDSQAAQDRISELDLRKMTLEAAVAAEKLSFEDYLQLCSDQIPIYQMLIPELMKLAKWYLSQGHKQNALLYKQYADYYTKCKETTELEVKTANENMDDEDE